MKRTTNGKKPSDDLRSEYDFDYAKSKPNRFASKLRKGGRLIILEPEVAKIFRDSGAVNKALREVAAAKSKR
jgi:hypothetical protein